MVICGCQSILVVRLSVVIVGYQCYQLFIQGLLLVIDGYQWLLLVISGYSWLSVVIVGYLGYCYSWLSAIIVAYSWLYQL